MRLDERRELRVVVGEMRDGVGEFVGEVARHVGDETTIGDWHLTVL